MIGVRVAHRSRSSVVVILSAILIHAQDRALPPRNVRSKGLITMLTPAHVALPRSAPLSRTRAALVCVSLSSTLLLSSIGFAQTQPPPPPPPGVTAPMPPPSTALPPPPQAPPTGATPPAGYAPPPAGYAPPPGYAPPAGYVPPPGYAPQPGYTPPPGYAPQPGYGPPPGDYGQTPPGYGPMPPGYQPYYGYGPYYGPPAGPPPPKYQRHNPGMMVGGVLLTTGGILGVLIGSAVATTAADQIPIYCNQPGFGVTVCETRADETQLAVGVVTLVTGFVAIGVGIPLWIVGGKREPVKEGPAGQPSQPTTPEAPKTSLELVVGPSSAALRATF